MSKRLTGQRWHVHPPLMLGSSPTHRPATARIRDSHAHSARNSERRLAAEDGRIRVFAGKSAPGAAIATSRTN